MKYFWICVIIVICCSAGGTAIYFHTNSKEQISAPANTESAVLIGNTETTEDNKEETTLVDTQTPASSFEDNQDTQIEPSEPQQNAQESTEQAPVVNTISLSFNQRSGLSYDEDASTFYINLKESTFAFDIKIKTPITTNFNYTQSTTQGISSYLATSTLSVCAYAVGTYSITITDKNDLINQKTITLIVQNED